MAGDCKHAGAARQSWQLEHVRAKFSVASRALWTGAAKTAGGMMNRHVPQLHVGHGTTTRFALSFDQVGDKVRLCSSQTLLT